MRKTQSFTTEQLIEWLLAGDVAIQYQVQRDLLDQERPDLRRRIAHEGWGAHFLRLRRAEGHWGRGFYSPKWTSTHYTLLDLKHLGLSPRHPLIRESVAQILEQQKEKMAASIHQPLSKPATFASMGCSSTMPPTSARRWHWNPS